MHKSGKPDLCASTSPRQRGEVKRAHQVNCT
jgi:hypothetical protein